MARPCHRRRPRRPVGRARAGRGGARGHRATRRGPGAGGRCRSYFDRELGCAIDNGNHLLLSGNRAAFAYLDTIGARDTLRDAGEPVFPFIDLATGERWTLRPESRPDPVVGVVAAAPRAGHACCATTWPCCGCAAPGRDATVATVAARTTRSIDRLIEPLAVAALNTPPDDGAGAPAGRGGARDADAGRRAPAFRLFRARVCRRA